MVGFSFILKVMDMRDFRELVWDFYRDYARLMPWRENPSPYNVVVSEFMLQQTQVSRVQPKFLEWVERWPDFTSLAVASTADVLALWKGLGYNRRALRLKEVARIVTYELGGSLPAEVKELERLPGIGPGTAGAIATYAYNQPAVFIETNIRRVFIHHFFTDADNVHDRELLPLIAAALDHEHPREWYWALMDYGSNLKTQLPNPNQRSRHYIRQSQFEGSHRQLRGRILDLVLAKGKLHMPVLVTGFSAEQSARAISELAQEGFLEVNQNSVTIRV